MWTQPRSLKPAVCATLPCAFVKTDLTNCICVAPIQWSFCFPPILNQEITWSHLISNVRRRAKWRPSCGSHTHWERTSGSLPKPDDFKLLLLNGRYCWSQQRNQQSPQHKAWRDNTPTVCVSSPTRPNERDWQRTRGDTRHVFRFFYFSLSLHFETVAEWNPNYVLQENGTWIMSQRRLWAKWTDPAVSVPAGGQRSGNGRRTKTLATCWGPWSGEQGYDVSTDAVAMKIPLSFPPLAPTSTFPGHRASLSRWGFWGRRSQRESPQARVVLKHFGFRLPLTKLHSRSTAH